MGRLKMVRWMAVRGTQAMRKFLGGKY